MGIGNCSILRRINPGTITIHFHINICYIRICVLVILKFVVKNDVSAISVSVIPGNRGIYITCNKVVLRCIAPVVMTVRVARRICIAVRVSRTVNFYGRIINILGRVSYCTCRVVYISAERSSSAWYVTSAAISPTSRKIHRICIFTVRIAGIRRNIKCNMECLGLTILKSDIVPFNCLPVNCASGIRRLWYKWVWQSINYVYCFRSVTTVSLVVCNRNRVGKSCFPDIN